MRSVILITILLAGCATQQYVWRKSGATQQDFYQDRGQCQAQAFQGGVGSLMQAAIIMNGCMQGKGWYQVPAN
jgi:hypothetical protein